eukprot:m51a1_g12052 hypothetical protein (1999) ;mRNA; r:108-6176
MTANTLTEASLPTKFATPTESMKTALLEANGDLWLPAAPFYFPALPAGSKFIIRTGGGADTFNMTGVLAPVSVSSGAGNDTLVWTRPSTDVALTAAMGNGPDRVVLETTSAVAVDLGGDADADVVEVRYGAGTSPSFVDNVVQQRGAAPIVLKGTADRDALVVERLSAPIARPTTGGRSARDEASELVYRATEPAVELSMATMGMRLRYQQEAGTYALTHMAAGCSAALWSSGAGYAAPGAVATRVALDDYGVQCNVSVTAALHSSSEVGIEFGKSVHVPEAIGLSGDNASSTGVVQLGTVRVVLEGLDRTYMAIDAAHAQSPASTITVSSPPGSTDLAFRVPGCAWRVEVQPGASAQSVLSVNGTLSVPADALVGSATLAAVGAGACLEVDGSLAPSVAVRHGCLTAAHAASRPLSAWASQYAAAAGYDVAALLPGADQCDAVALVNTLLVTGQQNIYASGLGAGYVQSISVAAANASVSVDCPGAAVTALSVRDGALNATTPGDAFGLELLASGRANVSFPMSLSPAVRVYATPGATRFAWTLSVSQEASGADIRTSVAWGGVCTGSVLLLDAYHSVDVASAGSLDVQIDDSRAAGQRNVTIAAGVAMAVAEAGAIGHNYTWAPAVPATVRLHEGGAAARVTMQSRVFAQGSGSSLRLEADARSRVEVHGELEPLVIANALVDYAEGRFRGVGERSGGTCFDPCAQCEEWGMVVPEKDTDTDCRLAAANVSLVVAASLRLSCAGDGDLCAFRVAPSALSPLHGHAMFVVVVVLVCASVAATLAGATSLAAYALHVHRKPSAGRNVVDHLRGAYFADLLDNRFAWVELVLTAVLATTAAADIDHVAWGYHTASLVRTAEYMILQWFSIVPDSRELVTPPYLVVWWVVAVLAAAGNAAHVAMQAGARDRWRKHHTDAPHAPHWWNALVAVVNVLSVVTLLLVPAVIVSATYLTTSSKCGVFSIVMVVVFGLAFTARQLWSTYLSLDGQQMGLASVMRSPSMLIACAPCVAAACAFSALTRAALLAVVLIVLAVAKLSMVASLLGEWSESLQRAWRGGLASLRGASGAEQRAVCGWVAADLALQLVTLALGAAFLCVALVPRTYGGPVRDPLALWLAWVLLSMAVCVPRTVLAMLALNKPPRAKKCAPLQQSSYVAMSLLGPPMVSPGAPLPADDMTTPLELGDAANVIKMMRENDPRLKRVFFALRGRFGEDHEFAAEFLGLGGMAEMLACIGRQEGNTQSYGLEALRVLMGYSDGLADLLAHLEFSERLVALIQARTRSNVRRQAAELLFVMCNFGGFEHVHRAAKNVARARGEEPYAAVLALLESGDVDEQVNALTLLNALLENALGGSQQRKLYRQWRGLGVEEALKRQEGANGSPDWAVQLARFRDNVKAIRGGKERRGSGASSASGASDEAAAGGKKKKKGLSHRILRGLHGKGGSGDGAGGEGGAGDGAAAAGAECKPAGHPRATMALGLSVINVAPLAAPMPVAPKDPESSEAAQEQEQQPAGDGSAPPPPPPPPPMMRKIKFNKAPVVPKGKMKPLHWKRIVLDKEGQKGASVWDNLAEPRLDEDELYELFGADAAKRAAAQGQRAERKPRQLPDKRYNAIAIVSKKLPASFEELARAIRCMDFGVVERPMVRELCNNLPTAEEEAALRAAVAGGAELDAVEGLALRLLDVELVRARLRCWAFVGEFEERLTEVGPPAVAVQKACKELLDSECLRDLLAAALAIGNYLNGSNAQRGQADGFSVEALEKMVDLRDAQGTGSLFDHAVRYVGRRTLPDELPSVQRAAGIEFKAIQAAFNKLAAELQDLNAATRDALAATPLAPGDAFPGDAQRFFGEAATRLANLREEVVRTEQLFLDTVDFFTVSRESTLQYTTESFFGMWGRIIGYFARSTAKLAPKPKPRLLRLGANKNDADPIARVIKDIKQGKVPSRVSRAGLPPALKRMPQVITPEMIAQAFTDFEAQDSSAQMQSPQTQRNAPAAAPAPARNDNA